MVAPAVSWGSIATCRRCRGSFTGLLSACVLRSVVAESGQRGQQPGERHQPCQDAGSHQGAQPAGLSGKDPNGDAAGHSRGRQNTSGEVTVRVGGSVAEMAVPAAAADAQRQLKNVMGCLL